MENPEIFDSEYCNVQYKEKDNIVLITWKKYCHLDDYRRPAMYASGLLKKHFGSNLIIDARNGFEDDKEDIECGFSVLLPSMSESDCKKVCFIMNEISGIEEEISLWTKEFMKYFTVKSVLSYEEAVKYIIE